VPLGVAVTRTKAEVATTAESVRQRQLLLAVGHGAPRFRRRFLATAGPDGVGHERRSFRRTLATTACRPARVAARR